MARSSFRTYRLEAAKGSSGGNSTYNDLLASPNRKAVLTSASMIDLFAPFPHSVIAGEITVCIPIIPGVPANNSPRLFPVLNSRATRRALVNCDVSSVPLFVITPLDAGHFSFFVSFFMDSLVTTRYTFILLNLHVSLDVSLQAPFF